jgi:hypothetical protein
VKTPPFGLILVAAFAVGTGLNGLYTGAQDIRDAPNALATIVAVFSILMGIAGIAGAVLIWRQDRRAIAPLAVWAASAVGASTLAPRAYAAEAGWPAALLGGIMTAAVVVAIVVYTRWRLGVTARGESSPVS